MITSLRIKNFRSYGDQSFEFEAGVNIVVGPNASGKTNLLEAILVLCRGSSYRARDIDLVQNDQEWARLDSTDEQNQTRVVKLQKQGEKIDKTFEIDEQTRKRLNFAQTIPIVLTNCNQLRLPPRSAVCLSMICSAKLTRSIPSNNEITNVYSRSETLF